MEQRSKDTPKLGMSQPPAQECQQPMDAEDSRTRPPSRASQEVRPCDTLIWGQ
jgi:hypothetical protein